MLTTRLALFVAGLAFAGVASASPWPERPVKLLVGYAAGGVDLHQTNALVPRSGKLPGPGNGLLASRLKRN